MSGLQRAQPVELTGAQTEVLTLWAEGHDAPAIARRMQVSVHTVRDHLQNAVKRLDAISPTNAVYIATSLRLIPAAQQGAGHVR